ncbi:MAG TPA: isoamylase early set domain-containing protein [Melioribacteraceae bacterium]|nr:isoamylase early set domain-containing protein [Melioribacteraceae bacterium]
MAIEKKYSRDKKLCQVVFTLPAEISLNFDDICVVGDFNDWDSHKNKFTHRMSNGSISAEIVLETGREYCFKYLCNGVIWLNEPAADKQVTSPFGDSKNSVIEI